MTNKVTATHITAKHIKIKCDCKKEYHLFGSSGQFHNRTESREACSDINVANKLTYQ